MTERWTTTLTRALIALVAVSAVIFLMLLLLGFSPVQIAEMLSYSAAGEAVEPSTLEREEAMPRFSTADYAILGAYLLAMLCIGYFASRRIQSTRGFFIAEGRLNYVLVGLSLVGTYLSALTIMALPGASYGSHNWIYMVQLPFLILTAIVITRFVLPRYREAGVISVYEYLEQRIDVSVRVIASAMFVIFSIGRMGLVLYLPALAFHSVTGAPLMPSIIVMGVFITVYTMLGGIEAVVWTDVIQVVIFVAGAFVALGYVFRIVGLGEFLEVGAAHGKFELIRPSLNLSEMVTAWLILETIFQTIRIYATQQDMTQRYMTTDSVEKANRSVWISIIAYIPLGFLFYFIGTALYVFYQVNPTASLASRPDTIFPHFIVQQLPPGVAGLLLAAIFAAAMSSIDSLMNSSSTVCIEDFVKRFGRRRSDKSHLAQARVLTVLWGVMAIFIAMMFRRVEYAQVVWGQLMGFATNGVLGLMVLAFLPLKIHKWSAISGFVVSTAVLVLIMQTDINFLLRPVIGNTVCVLVALTVNPLFAEWHPTAHARAQR